MLVELFDAVRVPLRQAVRGLVGRRRGRRGRRVLVVSRQPELEPDLLRVPGILHTPGVRQVSGQIQPVAVLRSAQAGRVRRGFLARRRGQGLARMPVGHLDADPRGTRARTRAQLALHRGGRSGVHHRVGHEFAGEQQGIVEHGFKSEIAGFTPLGKSFPDEPARQVGRVGGGGKLSGAGQAHDVQSRTQSAIGISGRFRTTPIPDGIRYEDGRAYRDSLSCSRRRPAASAPRADPPARKRRKSPPSRGER